MSNFNNIRKIVITGLPRSGTTLFGNILGSCQNVEYFFEPPMINTFLKQIKSLEKEVWLELFETYCVKDLLYNSLSARSLNFNTNDDSYIFNRMSNDEVNQRLQKSWRSAELKEVINQKIFSFKTPGFSSNMITLFNYLENPTAVVLFRNYDDILKSIIKKGWFDSKNPNIITPYTVYKGEFIPYPIPDTWYAEWSDRNQVEKAIIYMNSQFTEIEKLNSYVRINYDDFIKSPLKIYEYLDDLGLKSGPKTKDLIESIEEKKPKCNFDYSKVSDSSLLKDVEYYKNRFEI